MAGARSEEVDGWTDGGAAVLAALADPQHALTPLHASQHWRRASELLSAALPMPPRVRLQELPGVGFWLSAESGQPLVEAARRLCDGALAGGAADLGFRFGAHVAQQADQPSESELGLAQRLASVAPVGHLCLSAELVDRLERPWELALQDQGCVAGGPADGLHVLRVQPQGQDLRPRPAGMHSVLAVLPPALGGNGPKQVAVAAMVADALIVGLSRSSQLRVVAPQSSQGLRHSRQAVADAFQHLNAAYVISGQGGLGMGDGVFIDLRLHARGSEQPLWSERVQFKLVDLLHGDALALAQACSAVHAVLCHVHLEAVRSKPWHELERYQMLSAATVLMHKLSPAAFESSRRMLDWLVESRPEDAEPHAWLAQWELLEVAQGGLVKNGGPKMLAHCERALERDPQQPLAHALAGHALSMLNRPLEQSLAHHRAALAANPNSAIAWVFYALQRVYADSTQEACEAAQLGLALSPLDPWRYFLDSVMAHALLANNQIESALAYAEHSAQQRAQHAPTLFYLAVAHARLGHDVQAGQASDRLRRMWPGYSVQEFRRTYWGRTAAHTEDFARGLIAAGMPLD